LSIKFTVLISTLHYLSKEREAFRPFMVNCGEITIEALEPSKTDSSFRKKLHLSSNFSVQRVKSQSWAKSPDYMIIFID